MNTKEVNKLTGIPIRTLERWRIQPVSNSIPHTIIHRRAFYQPDDVAKWLANHQPILDFI